MNAGNQENEEADDLIIPTKPNGPLAKFAMTSELDDDEDSKAYVEGFNNGLTLAEAHFGDVPQFVWVIDCSCGSIIPTEWSDAKLNDAGTGVVIVCEHCRRQFDLQELLRANTGRWAVGTPRSFAKSSQKRHEDEQP